MSCFCARTSSCLHPAASVPGSSDCCVLCPSLACQNPCMQFSCFPSCTPSLAALLPSCCACLRARSQAPLLGLHVRQLSRGNLTRSELQLVHAKRIRSRLFRPVRKILLCWQIADRVGVKQQESNFRTGAEQVRNKCGTKTVFESNQRTTQGCEAARLRSCKAEQVFRSAEQPSERFKSDFCRAEMRANPKDRH